MGVTTAIPSKPYGPLEHCDYRVLDARCICKVCVEWREALAAYEAGIERCSTHIRGCKCLDCKGMFRARSRYLAAMNRRDLYSESSFHASRNMVELTGFKFMGWVTNIVGDRIERPDGWWEKSAPLLPLAHWFNKFNRSVSIAGSGFAPHLIDL